MGLKKTIGLLGVLLAAASFLPAEFSPQAVKEFRLDNGLKVLLVEDHAIANIACYTFFRVGSRNERVGLTGVSHFIEHMMFNGTERHGPGEFDRLMEFNGGANNAYTGLDMTAYTDWYPSRALEPMVALEADRMQGVLFDPQVFESERGVIASERRMSTDNNNENLLSETVQATAIMAHPYHWNVIGWMSDILNWKRDEVIAYYRTFYAPGNAVVVVVGDFAPAPMEALIRQHYGKIPAGPPPPRVTTIEPPQLGPRRVIVHKEAQLPSFLMVYQAPAVGDPAAPALNLLETVLLRGESSRLYRRLVAEEQLALSVGGGFQDTLDPYLFQIEVKPKAGADLDRIERIIDEELARIARDGVTPEELQKAKNVFLTRFYESLQTIAGKADMLGRAEVLQGGWQALFTEPERTAAVTVDALRRNCAQYLTAERKTVGVLLPKKEGDR